MHRGIIPWNRLEIQGGQWPRFEKSGRTAVHVSSTYQDFGFFFLPTYLLTYVTTVKTEIKESMDDAQFVLTLSLSLSRLHTGSTPRPYVCKAEKSLTRLTSKVLWPQKEGYYVGGGCFKLAGDNCMDRQNDREGESGLQDKNWLYLLGPLCESRGSSTGRRGGGGGAVAAVVVTAPYGCIRTLLHYADAF